MTYLLNDDQMKEFLDIVESGNKEALSAWVQTHQDLEVGSKKKPQDGDRNE